ncbi:hypothetical protein [Hymenobacter terricola]|uniref:hypothetical protein n=1 Tax=Hymenobacter terricola TaxID=2819236 RepID=UPI001B304EC5|nr:hypothetical protein [Hymenobacter terricola]
MRPFLLLGDISGSLIVLGLVVLGFGGLTVFGGIRLQRPSPTATGSKGMGLGCVVMAIGMVVVLIAFSFLSDVWEDRPSRVIERQMEEIEEREEARNAALPDTSWVARDRKTNQESDSASRHVVQQDSIARARAENAAQGW